MLIIKEVDKNGIGRELKFGKGDAVISFDGFETVDALDYLYYDQKEKFTLILKRKNGKEEEFEIEKYDDETLGLTFESDNLAIRTCHNNCIFCFVDQMPPKMRESLYIKDDDYRQSFICGNFVTLTNITEADKERIIRLGLSPLYISVHTMNPELRSLMMNNRFAGKIVGYLKEFAAAGIKMNTQIVLVKGKNDGKELEYSARELFKLYPNVQTMAVVPCGITRFRENLTAIEDITPEYALSVIEQTRALNKEFGENFIQLGDEFYFRAGIDVEPYEFYGNFPQIENGVGTTAKFKKELFESLEKRVCRKKFLLVCGISASAFIKKMSEKVKEYVDGVSIEVLIVVNKFFGETINCTGLLTGGDILQTVLSYKGGYDCLVMPDITMKSGEEVFLDDMKLSDLEEKIGKPIRITDGSGKSFFETLSQD